MLATSVPKYDWTSSRNATAPERLRACASNETMSGKLVPATVMPPPNVPSVSTPEAVRPQELFDLMGLPPHPPMETAAHNKRGKHRRMKALGADQGIVPAFGITILLRKVRAHLQWRAKTTWPRQLVEQGTEELARISGGVASGRGRMRAMAASRSLA
jgi:hypothetical protein